jgi:hypothetical protein
MVLVSILLRKSAGAAGSWGARDVVVWAIKNRGVICGRIMSPGPFALFLIRATCCNKKGWLRQKGWREYTVHNTVAARSLLMALKVTVIELTLKGR